MHLAFILTSVIVPLIVCAATPIILQKNGFSDSPRLRTLLYLAGFLYFISWYLPSPLIHGEDTSFTTHFVGGGIFTGLYWLYLKKVLNWRAHWLPEAFSLFALVSALGCMNELGELFLLEIGAVEMKLDDTNWDILANSLGALLVGILYLFFEKPIDENNLSDKSSVKK